MSLPRRRRSEAAMHIPTPAEVGSIFAASEDYRRPLRTLAAFAGLRLGEASAIRVSDVDFRRRRLRVERQIQRGRGELEIRPPKCGSERTVYLPNGLLELLSRHLEVFGVGTAGWLVTGGGGGPLPPTTANAWWLRTTDRAGVSARMHDLRHFNASGLIAKGCDVVTVQRALGHSAPSTTLNTYSHLWPTAEDWTRAAASELFRSA